ncbi:MAG: hypothetical protein R3B84_00225 [Zavarzinella sp.]
MNRDLIDTIKAHLADKSTAHLQKIVSTEPEKHWSLEALEAAEELLLERKNRLAEEPAAPTVDQQPEYTYNPEELANSILFSLCTGFLYIPYYHREEALPIQFGQDITWFAIESRDIQAVATAFQLTEIEPVEWEEGVDAAHRDWVFVSPPVGDWILVVGRSLLMIPDRLTELMEQLSNHFSEVQYFSNQVEVELYIWARAREGKLERAFGWIGKQENTFLDIGVPSDEEEILGISTEFGEPRWYEPDQLEFSKFQLEHLFELANHWSIDPMSLDEDRLYETEGLQGKWKK